MKLENCLLLAEVHLNGCYIHSQLIFYKDGAHLRSWAWLIFFFFFFFLMPSFQKYSVEQRWCCIIIRYEQCYKINILAIVWFSIINCCKFWTMLVKNVSCILEKQKTPATNLIAFCKLYLPCLLNLSCIKLFFIFILILTHEQRLYWSSNKFLLLVGVTQLNWHFRLGYSILDSLNLEKWKCMGRIS